MIIVQWILNRLIIVTAGSVALLALLLFLLYLSDMAKNKLVQKMREKLLCILSGETNASRIRVRLQDLARHGGGSESISSIRGIRTQRGMQVIAETAGDLTGMERAALTREVGGEWYGRYLKRQLRQRNVESVILAVRLTGVLGLREYIADIVTQIYSYSATTQIQHIGMLSLCLLGAEKDLVAICRDQSVASLLSFRTLEQLFVAYTGDREKLCRLLIDTAADQYIRRTCIKVIGEQGYTRLAPLVMPHLESDDINVRIDAVRTLGTLEYGPALARTRTMQTDDRWEVRVAVAAALGRYGAEENMEPLLALLCDREWWVRFRAAEALTGCVDKKALLERVDGTHDRYASEMMRFALDKRMLTEGGAA